MRGIPRKESLGRVRLWRLEISPVPGVFQPGKSDTVDEKDNPSIMADFSPTSTLADFSPIVYAAHFFPIR